VIQPIRKPVQIIREVCAALMHAFLSRTFWSSSWLLV
jgi:hypothetical protein